MARIRHIALVTDDPATTAEFYKRHFGLTELYRRPGDTGAKGVWLSDGYIYFAVLKYGETGVPKLGAWTIFGAARHSPHRVLCGGSTGDGQVVAKV